MIEVYKTVRNEKMKFHTLIMILKIDYLFKSVNQDDFAVMETQDTVMDIYLFEIKLINHLLKFWRLICL